MDFRFHRQCAINVATVLGKVKAFDQLKTANHDQKPLFELTA
jgi:hypothetical protein